MSSEFQQAVEAAQSGNVEALSALLADHPNLATERDESSASLLIHLFDWPGNRPRAVETARVLLEAGAEVDARRDDGDGTVLTSAISMQQLDVIEVLLEFGADIHAPLGWRDDTVLGLVKNMCADLQRAGEENMIALARIFSEASGEPVPGEPRVGSVVPMLFAKDVPAAVKWYCDVLHFRLNFFFEDCPDEHKYASVMRGAADIHITGCACDDRRHIGNLWTRIDVDDVDGVTDEFRTAGVPIHSGPDNEPWGLREVTIEDPDGNRLTFTGPITE